MSCTCQQCGKNYHVDFVLSEPMWLTVTLYYVKKNDTLKSPKLLCGSCIAHAIEEVTKPNYGAYKIKEI